MGEGIVVGVIILGAAAYLYYNWRKSSKSKKGCGAGKASGCKCGH